MSSTSAESGFRRSPFLVTYWAGGEHRVFDYCGGAEHHCPQVVLAVLEKSGKWCDREEMVRALPDEDPAAINRAVDGMLKDGLLESADRPSQPGERALKDWGSWNPVAGLFHAATKHAPFGGEVAAQPQLFRDKEFPPPLKEYENRARVELPPCESTGRLGETLDQRRTWREFGKRNLSLKDLATLLGSTFGVQKWMEVEGGNWVALKTSPSGGARHSIEAYVFAFGVDGLDSGTYHYNPDTHALVSLGPAVQQVLAEFIPGRKAFHGAAAFIVLTSVFARMQYKYPHPHAYRVVLLDAGHLSQTFALVATTLGLAPYCTAAIDSAAIERHLELDGISESAILGLGVGSRPAGKDWSPMHDHSAPPRTRPPTRSSRAK